MLYFQNSLNAGSTLKLRPDLSEEVQDSKTTWESTQAKYQIAACGDSINFVACGNSINFSQQSGSDNQKPISLGKRKAEICTPNNKACNDAKKQKLVDTNPTSKIFASNPKQTITLRDINFNDSREYRYNLNKNFPDYASKSINELKHILEQPLTSNQSIGDLFLEKLNKRIITVLSKKPPEDKFDLDDFFNFLNPVPTVMSLWDISLSSDSTIQTITELRQRMPVLLFYYWLAYYIHNSPTGNYNVIEFSKFVTNYIKPKTWKDLKTLSLLYGLKYIPAEKLQAAIWYLSLGKEISDIIDNLLPIKSINNNSTLRCKHTLFNIASLQGFLDITNQSLSNEKRKLFDEIKQEYDHITGNLPPVEAMHFDNTDLQQEMPYTNGFILDLAQNKKYYG
jgi:hypothetical protein